MIKKYASYFAAFLLNNLDEKNLENIERIVLYGSVARGEADEESDVDIFIEVRREGKKFSNEINKFVEMFYRSREATLFKLKGIENKINVKIGKLKDWKELYGSIASDGIVLYGPYEAKKMPSGAKHYVIIYWDKIGKNRGAFLNRIYGFSVKGKRYEGFLEKFEGRRLGKSCIILPASHKKEVVVLLKDYKVNAKIFEVFME